MSLNPGDQISYRLMPEIFRYTAVVLSINDDELSLRLQNDAPPVISLGQYVMITEADIDVEHYSEVTAWDGRSVQLRRMWTGKRGYFRVDDVFPVIHRKIDSNDIRQESRLFSGYGTVQDELEVPDESVNPRLWKMLVDMNAKLEMVLERLSLENEGLSRAESIPVNLSASGLRFTLAHKFEVGDTLELKLLLPVYPPVGLLANGAVVRVEELDNGNYGTSLRFVDLTEEVRDVIIQYALKRQREINRRQRRWDRAG